VTWNSEAGCDSGTIIKVHRTDLTYIGYTHHATKDQPQYETQGDKTDYIAMHKGSALKTVEMIEKARSREAAAQHANSTPMAIATRGDAAGHRDVIQDVLQKTAPRACGRSTATTSCEPRDCGGSDRR
jgi:hypothetical protein